MSDEYAAEVLRRGAGRLPSHAPVADIQARADRLGRRRRSAVVVVATGLCAAVVVTALVVGAVVSQPGDDESSVVLDGDAEGAAPAAGDDERCPAPVARPTYLPWVGAEEHIPDAMVATTTTGTELQWSTADAAGTAAVTLRRRHGDVGPDDGREIPAYVGGFAGRLTRGAAGSEADVVWNLGGSFCGVLELHVQASPATALDRPVRVEAIEIARALEAPGGSFAGPSGDEDATPCPPPPVTPTYLPWLAPDEGVPRPEVWKGGPEDGDSHQLNWWPNGHVPADEPYLVALRRLSEPGGTGGGDPTGIVVEGAEGVSGGGPMPGDVWVGWNIGGRSCNLVELELTTSGRMTAALARREILRIAESFARHPATSGTAATPARP
jgi:hypothetical protein